jgi:hypothetical protein
LRRHREYHVEVRYRQQELLLLLQPYRCTLCTTLSARTIAARMILNEPDSVARRYRIAQIARPLSSYSRDRVYLVWFAAISSPWLSTPGNDRVRWTRRRLMRCSVSMSFSSRSRQFSRVIIATSAEISRDSVRKRAREACGPIEKTTRIV